MPIPIEAANQHINTWSHRLGNRGHWAKHLFFAADAITAAEIIRCGRLICRRDVGHVANDIANQEALAVNPAAHEFVRLYFRPRTDFHLRTEGIKLLSDRLRLPHHMSIPIMFVLRLDSVVTLPGVCFSNRKMAHANITPGDNLNYFSEIKFEKVYHEAPISDPIQKKEIHDIRMAEVLVPGELPLAGHLAWILCRTQLDALSLRHLVGGHSQLLNQHLRVSTRPSEIFFCWGAYIDEADLANGILAFRVKSSKDYRRDMELKFCVQRFQHSQMTQEWTLTMPLTGKPIRLNGFHIEAGGYWKINVEDALAFAGDLPERNVSVFRPD